MSVQESATSGNTEEDLKIYEILCKNMEPDIEDVDTTTALRSEIAALQYKRDRLTEELNEVKGQMRSREQRCVELQVETDHLREQSARQNAIIASLKKRIHELEERERELYASQGRSDIALQAAQRDSRYNEDRAKDFEKKLRSLELDLSSQEQKKESARNAFQDLIRRLSVALGTEISETSTFTETLIHKASELVQETGRLRSRAHTAQENLAVSEVDLRTLRETLDRSMGDNECLQRQSASQLLEIDRLRQDKESLEMQYRVAERDIIDLRDKLASCSRNLGSTSSNVAQLETTVCQLRDDLKIHDEKYQRLHSDHRSTLESIALLLSTPSRYIDTIEDVIKDRIREILSDNRDKAAQIEALREKVLHESQHLNRQVAIVDQVSAKNRNLEEERSHLEHKLHKADTELGTIEISREGLKRDKETFLSFLERLARAMNMDEISSEIGVDLHTESLLLRAEQLARMENEKLVDKLLCCGYGTLPRLLRRERTYHDLPWYRETAVVYQLQRRVRTLREQLQRKDLHLDLLRRKLALQEDNTKTKFLLQGERDEANLRIKKLTKQIDRLHLQLGDAKDQIRDLNTQLAEAADYKISTLERARKIEDLQKRLIESESLRTKYNRKMTLLKDQVRSTGQTIDQERSISEHSLQLLRDELSRVKDNLSEISRRETQLQIFKSNIAKILGVILPMPDYELVARLQKLVDAHHDFTTVSRRYDDPVLRMTSRSPTLGSRYTRTPDKVRYDDSGYTDGVDFDDIDTRLYKRPP